MFSLLQLILHSVAEITTKISQAMSNNIRTYSDLANSAVLYRNKIVHCDSDCYQLPSSARSHVSSLILKAGIIEKSLQCRVSVGLLIFDKT